MHVNDEIAHMGIVNSLLRLGLPCRISSGIVRINADDIEPIEILEFGPLQVGELAAEDEMEQLATGMLIRHVSASRSRFGPAASVYPISASHPRLTPITPTSRSPPPPPSP